MLYFDGTHDNQITTILSAIGLKNGTVLPATGPPPAQAWVTSQITPYSGRLVTERMHCQQNHKQYIRFFIVRPLGPSFSVDVGSGF